MALSNPFDPPPTTPISKEPTANAIWTRWFWMLWKRIQTGSLGGTVTSVGLSLPSSVFDVTGSPVTSSGTLAATFDNQTNNTVWAGPATAPASAPTFRALVAADIPSNTPLTVGTTPIVSGTVNRILFEGSGNLLAEDADLTFDAGTNTLATANLTTSGNATFGDTSGDSLTINAGTWTIGNSYTATLSAGTVAAGSVNLEINQISFTGDSGGTSSVQGIVNAITAQGSSNIALATALRNVATYSGSATITNIIGASQGAAISSTGSATNALPYNATLTLSNSGSVTAATYYRASAPTLSSTGTVGTMRGFLSQNLGNATLVTNAIGHDADNMTLAATLTVSFRSAQNSGTGAWGFLHTGTANNGFNGNVRIGSTVAPTAALDVTGAALISSTLGVTGIQTNGNKIYPGTDAAATQSAAGLYAGTGAPNNANGSNGDFFFRSDGGALTTIYQRRAGAWVGVV